MAMATTVLTIAAGVQVIVPDSIESLTTYVLKEQQDWFEEEIKVVRNMLQPGDVVIDIGANHGVYALSMAKAVGATGRVVAFEPATQTRTLLEASARLNGFDQLIVDHRGVAEKSGVAFLSIDNQCELNQIATSDSPVSAVESIELTSLDDWLESSPPQRPIRLIKIDAEGQEMNILRGAEKLLEKHSPLILYEIRHDLHLHFELVEAFASHGYQSYRLLPGPQLLEPFAANQPYDAFLLNLFCCKPQTARALQEQGRLVLPAEVGRSARQSQTAIERVEDAYGWQRTLKQFPYAQHQWPLWLKNSEASAAAAIPLALHALSMDPMQSPADRALALHQSVQQLHQLCISTESPLYLSSLARAARDAGERRLAVEALDSLINALPWLRDEDFQAPFLSPLARFDMISTKDSLQKWLIAAAIEAHEELRHHSSFFSNSLFRDRLVYALDLGYESEPLLRRLNLINRRFSAS
jgi:FkbM family methyltransferase